MSYILGSELIQIADVADLVDSMTQSIDLNGPAECDDSATTLLAMILAIRDHGKFSSTLDSSGNVLRWLFGRWSPCRSYFDIESTRLTECSKNPRPSTFYVHSPT